MYALHDALDCGASEEAILSLIQANEDAVYQVARNDDLPLHKAIKNEHSDTVILTLLDKNKDAACKGNPTGYLPLHAAIELKFSDTVILALLEATAKIYCNEQLYNAIVRECPDEIILALLATNIEAAKKLDLDGNLPLLKTNECKSSDDVVSSLLAAEKSIALIYEGKYFF